MLNKQPLSFSFANKTCDDFVLLCEFSFWLFLGYNGKLELVGSWHNKFRKEGIISLDGIKAHVAIPIKIM